MKLLVGTRFRSLVVMRVQIKMLYAMCDALLEGACTRYVDRIVNNFILYAIPGMIAYYCQREDILDPRDD